MRLYEPKLRSSDASFVLTIKLFKMINVYGSKGLINPIEGRLTEYTLSGFFKLLATFKTEQAALEYRKYNKFPKKFTHITLAEMHGSEGVEIYRKSDTEKY